MIGDATGHDAIVGAALRRVGWGGRGTPGDIRLLAGGLSGSAVYRLEVGREDVVLKVTRPGGDPHALERARREGLFYRDLAGRVPLAVPRVLGSDLDEAEGVLLLLAASEPSPEPDGWTEDDFAQVARQLGRLHAAFWDKTTELGMPAWLRPKPPLTIADCRDAATRWRALGERDHLRATLLPSSREVERLLERLPTLEPRLSRLPATLCHGDCHTGNLLRDPAGGWVWADWQEVRLGPGVDDLSFLWQRAFAATDRPPPYEAIARAYGEGLETDGGVRIGREELARELAWAELRSWLVAWPLYLGFLPVTRVERVVRRIEMLIERVEAGIAP